MNKTIEKQLAHRTIREFKDESIPEAVFSQLLEVGRRTATSTGMQASSIIRISDKALKKEISQICNQEYVARAPELLIFIVDLFRNKKISNEKKCYEDNASDMDKFFSGFTDACIMAQNMVNAAESMDLGTVYLGSILNDSEKICKLLKLPNLTFPVVGLGIGYPNQNPQIKPKMDMEFRVFENKYKIFDNYLEELKDYDEEMHAYYDLRDTNNRVDTFSDQVVTRMKNPNTKRAKILKNIQDQGFNLNVNKG